MKILVCAESLESEVAPVSLELMTAAAALVAAGGEVEVFHCGPSSMAARASFGAAARLYTATHPETPIIPAAAYGELAMDVIAVSKPDLILVPYTANGLDVAPYLAARTGHPLLAYAVGLERGVDGIVAKCQIYGGKVIAEASLKAPAIVVVNPGAFIEAEAKPIDDALVTAIDIGDRLTSCGIALECLDVPDATDIDLTTMDRIVCVGRGIGDESGIEAARNLASLLGAEIAGSRPVIDRGWLPKHRQVGKSGQKVKPKLYMALGVSGAPEHLEGMSRSGLIVAVNTDPKAPIFNVAHYAATCDLFDLVSVLTERLQSSKTS